MSSIARFPCAGCGSGMVYDPPSGGLRCPACGLQQAIAAAQGSVGEHDFAAAAAASEHALSPTALEASCSSCGASFTFEPPQVAGACPFCAARIVNQPHSPDPLVAPSGVLPFALTPVQAAAQVRGWIASLWFAPSGLKRFANLDQLQGVYLPYWTFGADTETRYHGERGDNYTVTRTVMRDGRPTEERVTETRWTSVSGRVQVPFRDLFVLGSKAVHGGRLEELTPWDLDKLVPYQPAYLAGYSAQRYQVPLTEAFQTAQRQMAPGIQSAIRRDIGGDQQRIHSSDSRYYEVTFRHLLLPVWMGSYRYGANVFQVAVNARTGEVQGERPISWLKVAALVLLVILAIGLIAYWNQ